MTGDAVIVEIEGVPAAPPGHDRRRAIAIAFGLCLAVGAAGVGRDGPVATAPGDGQVAATLELGAPDNDIALFTFPDRLANEAMPQYGWVAVSVRGTTGLAIDAQRIGDGALLTWTERGTVYRLTSDHRPIDQLI